MAFLFMLTFARVGTMTMLMPAIGERTISTRVRLGFALALTFVLYPLAQETYPQTIPEGTGTLMLLVGGEFIVGFFVGLAARLILSALQVAGATIAGQSGLAFAQSFDPSQGTQGALFGNFLGVLGLTMIFATDLHHLVIGGIHDSFKLFPPGEWMPVGDLAKYAVMTVADAFKVGIQIAAPFLVFGIIFYFGLGLLNRLMPQIQIFFIAMPANITFGLILLFLLLSTMMTWYLAHFETAISRFISG